MPRIFWSKKRKAKLLKQSLTMTTTQMARKHMRDVADIERMLKQLSPNNPLIKEVYFEGKIKIIVYYPAYADGVRSQFFHGTRSLF